VEFIVEDGTGLENSNSYLSIDRFKDISDLLGYDYTSLTDLQIERFLMRSAIILDSNFRSRLPGSRANTGQALEWPREYAYYVDQERIMNDIVPKEVEMASVEMLYLLNSGVNPQANIDPVGVLKEERVKVDVIEEQKKYATATGGPKRQVLVSVEDAMSRITGGVGSLYRLNIIRVGG